MTDEPIKFRKFNCPHCDTPVLTNALTIAPYTCPHCSKRITELPPQEQCETILDEKGLGIPIAISTVTLFGTVNPYPVPQSSIGTWFYRLGLFMVILISCFLPYKPSAEGMFYKILWLPVIALGIWLTLLPLYYLSRIARALEEASLKK